MGLSLSPKRIRKKMNNTFYDSDSDSDSEAETTRFLDAQGQLSLLDHLKKQQESEEQEVNKQALERRIKAQRYAFSNLLFTNCNKALQQLRPRDSILWKDEKNSSHWLIRSLSEIKVFPDIHPTFASSQWRPPSKIEISFPGGSSCCPAVQKLHCGAYPYPCTLENIRFLPLLSDYPQDEGFQKKGGREDFAYKQYCSLKWTIQLIREALEMPPITITDVLTGEKYIL